MRDESHSIEEVEKELYELGSAVRKSSGIRNRDRFYADLKGRIGDSDAQPSSRSSTQVRQIASPQTVDRWLYAAAAAIIFIALGYAAWIVKADSPDRIGFVLHAGNGVADTDRNLAAGEEVLLGKDNGLLVHLDGDRIQAYYERGSVGTLLDRDTIALESGALWVVVAKDSGRFEVQLPQGTVVVHGTSFCINADQTKSEIFLNSGVISFDTRDNSTIMKKGQLAVASSTTVTLAVVGDSQRPEWIDTLHANYTTAYNAAYFPSMGGK